MNNCKCSCNPAKKKFVRLFSTTLGLSLSIFLLFSAIMKIVDPEHLIEEAPALSSWIYIIIAGEIISALLFACPKTHKVGTLLLSSYMGGAIMVHMQAEESIALPAVFLILIWLTHYMKLKCSNKNKEEDNLE